MKKTLILIFSLFVILFTSCDVAENVMKTIEENASNFDVPLTKEEVAKDLKSALKVGPNTAVNLLHRRDGFFKDRLLKITFPEEANIILKHRNDPALKAIGISKMIDDAELRLNRAAEAAVNDAKPIFVNAITSMSIQDAFGILNGGDHSATEYLKRKTSKQLKAAFKPKIKKSLDKPLVGGISASKSWQQLTKAYNKVAQFVPELKPVNADLSEHVTEQALKGLFKKIAEEEKEIRHNPKDRVNDILKRVFGK